MTIYTCTIPREYLFSDSQESLIDTVRFYWTLLMKYTAVHSSIFPRQPNGNSSIYYNHPTKYFLPDTQRKPHWYSNIYLNPPYEVYFLDFQESIINSKLCTITLLTKYILPDTQESLPYSQKPYWHSGIYHNLLTKYILPDSQESLIDSVPTPRSSRCHVDFMQGVVVLNFMNCDVTCSTCKLYFA